MFDRKAIAVLAIVVFSCGTNRSADPPAIPADFKVVARYQPGLSSWHGWQDSIMADGKAAQVTTPGRNTGGKPTEKELNLSKDEIASLLAKVKESGFYGLREQYRASVTDLPTLILEVTLDKKTQKVEVYGRRMSDKDDQEAVERFLQVWSEVLRKVPSPNPAQKPEK
jgi:hypothetical protein